MNIEYINWIALSKAVGMGSIFGVFLLMILAADSCGKEEGEKIIKEMRDRQNRK